MSPWKGSATVGLLLLAMAPTHVLDSATYAADPVVADKQVIEISAPETVILRGGKPSRLRTLIVPTPFSTTRYVDAITIDTGDVPAEAVESVWVFGDGLLDHLVDEDEQPGFEGSIESRLTPLGTRVLASPPDGLPEKARSAWAWRLPPEHSIVVVVRLPETEKYRLLKLKLMLSVKDRPFNPPIVLWLAEDDDGKRTPYHHRVGMARGAQLLTVNSDSSRGILLLKSVTTDESESVSSWSISTKTSDSFVGAKRRIEFGQHVELSLASRNELASRHAEHEWPSAAALVLHASDELDRTLIVQNASKQEWQTRFELCRRGADHDPRDVLSRLTLGMLQMQQGNTAQAISAWREAVSIDAKFFHAHYHLARALASTDQIDAAISSYRDAIELRPTHARAHFGLAANLFRQRELRDALKHLLIAVEHENDYAPIHTNLAVLYGLRRDTDKQIEHFRIATELDPDAAGATIGLAQALAMEGRLADALRELDLALKRRPHNEMLLMAKARLLTVGDSDAAIAAFEAVLRSSPESIPAMTALAELLVERSADGSKDVARALNMMKYASEVHAGRDPEVLRALAECYIETERYSDAEETIEQAIKATRKSGADSAMMDSLDQLRARIRNGTPVTAP